MAAITYLTNLNIGGSGATTLYVNGTIGTNVYTFPAADGGGGCFMCTDGVGNLGWGTAGGAPGLFVDGTNPYIYPCNTCGICMGADIIDGTSLNCMGIGSSPGSWKEIHGLCIEGGTHVCAPLIKGTSNVCGGAISGTTGTFSSNISGVCVTASSILTGTTLNINASSAGNCISGNLDVSGNVVGGTICGGPVCGTTGTFTGTILGSTCLVVGTVKGGTMCGTNWRDSQGYDMLSAGTGIALTEDVNGQWTICATSTGLFTDGTDPYIVPCNSCGICMTGDIVSANSTNCMGCGASPGSWKEIHGLCIEAGTHVCGPTVYGSTLVCGGDVCGVDDVIAGDDVCAGDALIGSRINVNASSACTFYVSGNGIYSGTLNMTYLDGTCVCGSRKLRIPVGTNCY